MSFSFWRRKQDYMLGICVVFLVSLTHWMLWKPKRNVPSQKINNYVYQDSTTDKCTLQKEEKRTLEHLLLKQGYPWEPNTAAVAQYRGEMKQCCNASFWLVLTKENIALRPNIRFVKDLEQLNMLMDLLPERSPFLDSQYRHCAVVGSGGILRNSRCGQEIDQADLVIRFNLSPVNFSEDVGTKTGLMTINPSILQTRFKDLQTQQKTFIDALFPYRKALFLIPAFTYLSHINVGFRALYTMEDFGLLQQAFILNPHYLGDLSHYWEKEKWLSLRLSSGFVFVSVALEFCQHTTLYGFWPFPHDLDNQPIPHHYYDNRSSTAGIHGMSCEFSHYLSMYRQGVLQLRLGKCH